jgi:hypothetical protein
MAEADDRSRLQRVSKGFMDGVREIQLLVAGRPAVIRALIDRGIRGRDYVKSVRSARKIPLVLLTPN